MKAFNFLCATLCVGLLLGGCKGKDGDPGPAGAVGATGPAGPSGQNLTGSIVGFIELRDEFGRLQTKNGATVTLENVTPAITATTDANGRYELTNVRSGTYNIVFSKPGYGLTKVQGYSHAGGSTSGFVPTRVITGISTTSVSAFSVGSVLTPTNPSNYTGSYIVFILTTLTNSNLPAQSVQQGLLFVGSTSTVNSSTGISMGRVSNSIGGRSGDFLTRETLNQAGFVTGSIAYAIVYGAGPYANESSYTDPQTGRPVYNFLSTSPSRVVSFIVP